MSAAQEIAAAMKDEARSGNVAMGRLGVDSHIILDSTQEKAQAEHQALMAHFEDKKRKRDLTLPTTDRGVKLKLRSLGEPICLFGEEARDRRERLRELLVRAEDLPEGALAAGMEGGGAEGDEGGEQQGGGGDDKHSLFYTEGAEELKVGRQQIAKYSLARGGERVRQAKRRRERIEKELAQAAKDGVAWEDEAETSDLKHVAALENRSSQVGDDRPISTCAFSGDGGVVATGSWSGLIKLWETPGCVQRECGTLRGHTERVTSVAFHPDPSLLAEPRAHHLASGSADRKVQLWSLGKEEPLHSLEGHFDTVSSVTYHPSGKFLVSTSFDKTWRLWDLQTQQSLLVQEGHSKGVYTAACQVDGSLLATSGLDCAARIWDMRSGKCVLVLEGHVKQILGLDFNPAGYQVATGSADHTVRIWDLRRKNCMYIIPAHSNLISELKYQPSRGNYLVTSSYDHSCKIWHSKSFHHLKTLGGHENKIMSCDISRDGDYIATASYDRTWKLWGPSILGDLGL